MLSGKAVILRTAIYHSDQMAVLFVNEARAMSNTTHLEEYSLKPRGNFLLRFLGTLLVLCIITSTAEAFDPDDLKRLKETGLCKGCDLSKANLSGMNLQNAILADANLSNANLSGANLITATLTKAILRSANLTAADLFQTTLTNADLRHAKLINAELWLSEVTGARFADSDLTNALYSPASRPPNGYVERIKGLDTLRVRVDVITGELAVSGLFQLGKLLREAGLRDKERQITFSIERAKTRAALRRWREDILKAGENVLRLVFFEFPTQYDLAPGRALLFLIGLIFGMPFVYVWFIWRKTKGGIFLIWPDGRLVVMGWSVQVLTYNDVSKGRRASRLTEGWWKALGWSLYFSLLSSFSIGWRELNVGAWITKLQWTEYALRGRGWPRFFSGAQSLVSVYFLAIAALTYFTRVFQ